MNGKRVLVTGGAGFIGSHVVDELVSHGYTVDVFDALVPEVHGSHSDWPSCLKNTCNGLLVRGDVSNFSWSSLRSCFSTLVRDADYIIHFAAKLGVGESMHAAHYFVKSNSVGTSNVLQAIKTHNPNLKRLIVASSASIYGEGAYSVQGRAVTPQKHRAELDLANGIWDYQGMSPLPIKEADPVSIKSVYGLTKFDQEQLVMMHGRTFGLPCTALRFFNVYGPRQSVRNPYTGVMSIFAESFLNGKPPVIFEDGKQTRDFVFVKDVARAVRMAMETDEASGEVFNIGTGVATAVLDAAEKIRHILNMEHIPIKPNLKYRLGDIRHCVADIGLAYRLLGWKPEWSVSDGLAQLIPWVLEERAKASCSEQ